MWLVVAFPVSLLMIIVGSHFSSMLCNDHPAAFMMGLALARWTYLAFQDLQDMEDEKIDVPQAKRYELTELEAMPTIREMLTYTSLGDKWWHIRDLNLDDGRILANVNFEEEHHRNADIHLGKERVLNKQQIVLILKVIPRNPGAAANLQFIVLSTMDRMAATEVIKSLQNVFDEALTQRAESKKQIAEVAACCLFCACSAKI